MKKIKVIDLFNIPYAQMSEKINEEMAVIKEKYGSSTARKFRGYAISALVDGSKHALEKYESYLKLI